MGRGGKCGFCIGYHTHGRAGPAEADVKSYIGIYKTDEGGEGRVVHSFSCIAGMMRRQNFPRNFPSLNSSKTVYLCSAPDSVKSLKAESIGFS